RGQGLAESAGRPGGHPGFLALTFVSILSSTLAYASQAEPLVLESKIPLGDVKGRIDHLAVDAARQRLYIAELGNDTVGVVDVKARKLLWTLHGFREPQGIGYEPSTDTVYVASARDGSLHLLHGEDLTPAGIIELGADADRSEEHTSELQSRGHLVCRLLLEKKKNI